MLRYKRWRFKTLAASPALPLPPLPASCPSHLPLPALCSLSITHRRCQSLFPPCSIGRRTRRKRRRRTRGRLFAGEQLELALLLASGLWSTQLRGIRSSEHLSAALQRNNIPCPTNLHLPSSHSVSASSGKIFKTFSLIKSTLTPETIKLSKC